MTCFMFRPMSQSQLYKQYLRLLARWPREKYKAPNRDLAVFMEKEVEKSFKAEAPPSEELCAKKLKGTFYSFSKK